ncbi:hypothetical protein DRN63_03780 [Nanoarchaeota archaeon]|nr:MAG: hypothetical protein DRN63_03780 [Nanoarchaeota archaeon]
MVVITGDEISNAINELTEEVQELPGLKIDLLYSISAILMAVGEVKNVPTLIAIGKSLFVLPERFRPWLTLKIGLYGGPVETEELSKSVEKIFGDLVSALKEIAGCLKDKDKLTDNDFSSALKKIDKIINILPTPLK